ncbi:MAG TPA: Gfo/Idh/MocA family oxidoreductase [Tepidisphaeraceae bacterium]|jgi:predicted dehydrogenase|nr:Gfo/Idh/MocA family oxidoreductase [Tepidisphaeraceae bacterium]
MPHDESSRRQFLIASSAALLTAGLARAQATLPPLAPPDKQPPDLNVPKPVAKMAGWAVVGLGQLALGEVLPQFATCKLSRPTALVSGHRDKAEQVAATYGVPTDHIYNYHNYNELKNDATVDVVYVILPNHMHAEYTIRALEAGKHVLCEKPLAPTVADCQRMIDAAKANNRKLMTAYRLRYEPHNIAAIELARKGEFGKIVLIEAVNAQSTEAPNIRLSKETAGGPLGDVGIYCLNACRYITGEEPTAVQGMQHQPTDDPNFREVPATVTWTMTFPSGALANCSCSFNSHRSSRYRVHFEKGWLELDPAYPYRGLQMVVSDEEGNTKRKINDIPQFSAEMDHMSDCVLNDKPVLTPGEEGMADMKVIEAIKASIKSGKTEKV